MHITPRIVAFIARNHAPVHASQLALNNAVSAMAEAASYVAEEGSTREEHFMEGVDVIEHEFHRRKEGGRGDEIPDHQVATCEPKISAAGGYTKPPRETKRAEEEGRKHSEHHGIRADSGAESRGCPRCENHLVASTTAFYRTVLSFTVLFVPGTAIHPVNLAGTKIAARAAFGRRRDVMRL